MMTQKLVEVLTTLETKKGTFLSTSDNRLEYVTQKGRRETETASIGTKKGRKVIRINYYRIKDGKKNLQRTSGYELFPGDEGHDIYQEHLRRGGIAA